MASNVRNLRRYVLVTHEGAILEDFEIFVEGSTRVIVVYDGDRFEGDLLTLESLAKNNGAVAHPVAPPEGYDNRLTAIPFGATDVVTDKGMAGDWSDDQEPAPSPQGGVTLSTEESVGVVADSNSDQWPPAIDSPMAGGHAPQDPIKDPDEVKSPQEFHVKFPGDSNLLALEQGGLVKGTGLDGLVNPYDLREGDGLSSEILHVPGLSDQFHAYGMYWCRAPDIPPLPASLDRDLGNCSIGMPRYAGTTIAGRLRPDTGGVDPLIPDHIMWERYERQCGKIISPY